MSNQPQLLEAPKKAGFFGSSTGLKSFAAVAALILVLSWVRASPQGNQGVSTGGPAAQDSSELQPGEQIVPEGQAGGAASSANGPGAASVKGPAAQTTKNLECKPGRNGGATDKGVTATKIRLATTAVLDGPAKSLLEDSPVAMKAVLDKTNQAGGVCGRLLSLNVVNDSFVASTGLQYIKNFIAEGYFALPVVPSAEGLGAAILTGDISKAQIPVVGTDGMRKEQYADAYVWPVAAATITSMRVMAKYGAANRQAKTFALVYDQKYQFGVEGRDAFKQQVEAMGFKLNVEKGLNPDDPNYGSQASDFNTQCGATGAPGSRVASEKCDMVAMLLLPETAKKWLQADAAKGLRYTSGAQTLFTDKFAQDCVSLQKDNCQGFAVWTGYNPPIGPLASLPGVAQYVNDVRAVKSSIDVNNQFVEGAYLGMNVFVEALKKVGANLTRERLRTAMDSLTYTSDLSSPLTWKPGNHAANVRSQSFEMSVSQGSFRGWSNAGTGFLLDPAHGG